VEHGIDTELVMVVAAVVAVWAMFSGLLERIDLSAPLLFVAAGLVLANGPLSLVDVNIRGETLRSLAEVTLALLLFSDAARVNVRELRRDVAIPARLLFVALPLSIGLGTLVAALLFPDLDLWGAAVIAACVAPTDAALGAQVVEDQHVPSRIRRALGVESGLNDGIATPFVTFFIAGAVVDTVARSSVTVSSAVGELAVGVIVGVAVGVGGGWCFVLARRRDWSTPAARAMFVVALALLAYASSLELGGNGFIAAFVGGLAFGTVLPPMAREQVLTFDAQIGELLSLVVWFLFGAVMVSALGDTTWQSVVFVVLALTLVRMVPVAIALVGARLDRRTVLFVGWFGPRGLASVVFGLIAFDALEGSTADTVMAAVTLTVLVSVVAHGVTARPLSRAFGREVATLPDDAPERCDVPQLPMRRTRLPRS
jgi:NhaP-type Na+/H+ or K+/H+ antiporter